MCSVKQTIQTFGDAFVLSKVTSITACDCMLTSAGFQDSDWYITNLIITMIEAAVA